MYVRMDTHRFQHTQILFLKKTYTNSTPMNTSNRRGLQILRLTKSQYHYMKSAASFMIKSKKIAST